MAPDSRLLIAEQVLPERVYGDKIGAAIFDQVMLCIGGKERTVAAFRHVLEASGMELVEVHPMPGVAGAIIEGRLKQ